MAIKLYNYYYCVCVRACAFAVSTSVLFHCRHLPDDLNGRHLTLYHPHGHRPQPAPRPTSPARPAQLAALPHPPRHRPPHPLQVRTDAEVEAPQAGLVEQHGAEGARPPPRQRPQSPEPRH